MDMVGKLSITNLESDSLEYIGDEWYAFTAFELVESKYLLGIKYKSTRYGLEQLYLLVTSTGLNNKPADPAITEADFERRLTLKIYDQSKILDYIEQRVSEIKKAESVPEVFTYLEQYFVNKE